MRRPLISALLLLPFVAPWLLRAETAVVTVGATLGPETVTVELEENYARVVLQHVNPGDVVAWVILADGSEVDLSTAPGEWVCLLDCDPGVPLEAWAALRPLR